eukprot:3091835-Pleurochrysis_carterae.AAC.1
MQDLVNVRPCTETVSGVDWRPRPCVAVGDLPLSAQDSQNRIVDFTLTDVRCVPSMRDSLLSVGQLWSTNNTDCHFANTRALELPPDASGHRKFLPFIRKGGAYSNGMWRAATRALPAPVRLPSTLHVQPHTFSLWLPTKPLTTCTAGFTAA